MTRDEWKKFERIRDDANVQLALYARCEEDGHTWENRCTAGFRIYVGCKWCNAVQ